MIPPKDSRDPDWQGPLNKTELRKLDLYFYECLQAATCEGDVIAMEASPEWKAYLVQVEHDLPDLLHEGEYSMMAILEQTREHLRSI